LNLTGALEDSQKNKNNHAIQQKPNMKKLIPILSAGSLLFAGASARATTFNYNNGDLILDISQTGSPDFEVDLGNLTSLQLAASANGGTVVLSSGATQGYTLAQLSGNFANYNNLSLAIFGTTTGGANDVDYFTKKRTDITLQNTTPNDITPSTANTGGADILGVVGYPSGTGVLNYGGVTANVAEIPTVNVNSYTTKGNTALNSIANINSIKNTTGSSFTTGSVVSDLFEYNGLKSTTPSIFEGDFTFNSDGSLEFTAATVPEPATYTIMAVAGLLFCAWKIKLQRPQA
jgi:hypothetical protein